MFGRKWGGLQPKIIHWIYMTIFRLIITYGALVKETWKAMGIRWIDIKKVQRIAAMVITEATKSSPQATLEVLKQLSWDNFS